MTIGQIQGTMAELSYTIGDVIQTAYDLQRVLQTPDGADKTSVLGDSNPVDVPSSVFDALTTTAEQQIRDMHRLNQLLRNIITQIDGEQSQAEDAPEQAL